MIYEEFPHVVTFQRLEKVPDGGGAMLKNSLITLQQKHLSEGLRLGNIIRLSSFRTRLIAMCISHIAMILRRQCGSSTKTRY